MFSVTTLIKVCLDKMVKKLKFSFNKKLYCQQNYINMLKGHTNYLTNNYNDYYYSSKCTIELKDGRVNEYINGWAKIMNFRYV